MRALVFAAIALPSDAKHPVRQEIVDRVNNDPNAGWKAEEVEKNKFATHSEEEIKALMGLRELGNIPVGNGSPVLEVGDIPDSFDARTKFSQCNYPVRDQAHCGSCWAFGAAETLTDNLCILGVTSAVLSPQDLISCDKTDHACQGGTLPSAWDYIKSNGLIEDSDFSYQSGDGSCNNTCVPSCPHGFPASGAHKCPVDPSFLQNDAELQGAVMLGGAAEVGFFVMEDFMNYKSGIFKSKGGFQLGGHAVKIVGWGHEGTQFYWTVQNSWGADWGEQGYFRIVNWHDDMQSAFAIGGGQSCVSGSLPDVPTPPPTPPPCQDIASYCKDYDHAQCAEKTYLIPVCQMSCGCCDPDVAPDYCKQEVIV